MTEENKKDIEFVKSSIIKKISDLVQKSNNLNLPEEVVMSIVYLKIFSAYIQEKEFKTLDDSWRLMNDLKGIIEKIFYADHYVFRAMESMNSAKVSR